MLDTLVRLKELEKQGYKFMGSGFYRLKDFSMRFFVKFVKNGDEIELRFDNQEEIKVKQYLDIPT